MGVDLQHGRSPIGTERHRGGRLSWTTKEAVQRVKVKKSRPERVKVCGKSQSQTESRRSRKAGKTNPPKGLTSSRISDRRDPAQRLLKLLRLALCTAASLAI